MLLFMMFAVFLIRRSISIHISTSRPSRTSTFPSWLSDASDHVTIMNDLLYPKLPEAADQSLKTRMHAVKKNPIYNFLHTYYRYSAEELKLFSPGIGVHLQIEQNDDLALLHPRFRQGVMDIFYESPRPLDPEGRYGWILLSQARDVLKSTTTRSPNLGCFGLHEWAMLYKCHEKHQPTLSLRVPQQTIDAMVESSGHLKCSHYDAFRFFHPDARPFNAISTLSRSNQASHEQPGCIHATMDLFKYAYKIYPLCSASLLRRTLAAALVARKVDMRASPYDVSKFDGCEEPICVETAEGRKLYVQEQLDLAVIAAPLREELVQVYEKVLLV